MGSTNEAATIQVTDSPEPASSVDCAQDLESAKPLNHKTESIEEVKESVVETTQRVSSKNEKPRAVEHDILLHAPESLDADSVDVLSDIKAEDITEKIEGLKLTEVSPEESEPQRMESLINVKVLDTSMHPEESHGPVDKEHIELPLTQKLEVKAQEIETDQENKSLAISNDNCKILSSTTGENAPFCQQSCPNQPTNLSDSCSDQPEFPEAKNPNELIPEPGTANVSPEIEVDAVTKEIGEIKLPGDASEEPAPQKRKWPKKVKAPDTPLYLKGSDEPIDKEHMEYYRSQKLAVKASDAYLKELARIEAEIASMVPDDDWENSPPDIEEVEAPFCEPPCDSGLVEPPVPWSDEPEVPEVEAPSEPEPEPIIDSWLLVPTPDEDEELEEESDVSTKQVESESSDFSDSDELLATYARSAKFIKASSPDL
ncbi:hypothetical protein DSO57_1015709 [Entomophthora muscae]|uniref:Uncharacterized protein n=1 Tax=Entomophthora muscae TaxID=34485 RepID=A0ACC2RWE7_9FUNG|nr:hypothetical protein DSO57_1015709 [Entomophthora muscae]